MNPTNLEVPALPVSPDSKNSETDIIPGLTSFLDFDNPGTPIIHSIRYSRNCLSSQAPVVVDFKIFRNCQMYIVLF